MKIIEIKCSPTSSNKKSKRIPLQKVTYPNKAIDQGPDQNREPVEELSNLDLTKV